MARTLAMFTDVSLCIGCRACQVACKQWNQLAPEEPEWTGTYQNHHHFTDKSYRLGGVLWGARGKGANKQEAMMGHRGKHRAPAGRPGGWPPGASLRNKDARLYGEDTAGDLGGLNAFFLLLGKPSIYGLPEKPKLPQKNVVVDSLLSIGSALIVGLGALVAFRGRGGQGDA